MQIEECKIEDVIATRPQIPKELVKIISQYNSIISFRLHSHIIAYSLEIPSIAIAWDNKVNFFFKDIGYSERCKRIDSDPEEIVLNLLESMKKPYISKQKIKQMNHTLDTLINAVDNNI